MIQKRIMEKEEFEKEKAAIIKKNSPYIWWILSLLIAVIGLLSIEIIDYDYTWISSSLYGLAVGLYITGIFKVINKETKLEELEQKEIPKT